MARSLTMMDQAPLTLADLEAHDTGAPRWATERRFLCPWPACAGHQQPSRHRSLAVNMDTGLWICHRCRASGQLREYWPRGSAHRRRRAFARRRDRLSVPTRRPTAALALSPNIVSAQDRLGGAAALPGTPGAAYLLTRGIPTELADEAGVTFSSDFYGRAAVLFPLRDATGQLVAANGRYVDGWTDPKARTVGRKSLGVFATPGALGAETIVICEAPIDALSLAMCGMPSLALCGTSGPDWLAAACAFHRVLLALDADDPADQAASALSRTLRSFGARVSRLRPEGGKDWNELLLRQGADGLRAALANGAAP